MANPTNTTPFQTLLGNASANPFGWPASWDDTPSLIPEPEPRENIQLAQAQSGFPGPANSGLFPETLRDPRHGLFPHQRGYPPDPNALINGSQMVTDFSKRYDPTLPTFHHYQFTDQLCDLGDPNCTVERAYAALQRQAVPGGEPLPVPFPPGTTSNVTLAGGSGGHVTTYAENSSHSIINKTANDHVFKDGIVQRQIVADGNKLYVRTFGIGNNDTQDLAQKNMLLARPAFETSTARIRTAVAPLAPSWTPRDGEPGR